MAIRNRHEPIKVTCPTTGPSKTIQSMRDDCDVNLIVKRHASTGLWSHLAPTEPIYGDFTQATDLQTAIERVDQAEASFMELPAAVRQRCLNDPVEFLKLIAAEDTFAELVKLGLPVADTYVDPTATPAPEPPPAPDPEPTA